MSAGACAGGEEQHLRLVERPAPGALSDLLAAAEAVCDHQSFGRCSAHRREEHPLADRERDVEVGLLEPEGAGHPAAAGVGNLDVEPGPVEKPTVGFDPEDRALVAVEL